VYTLSMKSGKQGKRGAAGLRCGAAAPHVLVLTLSRWGVSVSSGPAVTAQRMLHEPCPSWSLPKSTRRTLLVLCGPGCLCSYASICLHPRRLWWLSRPAHWRLWLGLPHFRKGAAQEGQAHRHVSQPGCSGMQGKSSMPRFCCVNNAVCGLGKEQGHYRIAPFPTPLQASPSQSCRVHRGRKIQLCPATM
jgi:hypothetical protein